MIPRCAEIVVIATSAHAELGIDRAGQRGPVASLGRVAATGGGSAGGANLDRRAGANVPGQIARAAAAVAGRIAADPADAEAAATLAVRRATAGGRPADYRRIVAQILRPVDRAHPKAVAGAGGQSGVREARSGRVVHDGER